ncbi:hypothetical protein DFH27DRAFT_520487 [Peziza echinospora]|nr:hypothetical protein DFH27DRAFT_520487 [Peziza echinospora]
MEPQSLRVSLVETFLQHLHSSSASPENRTIAILTLPPHSHQIPLPLSWLLLADVAIEKTHDIPTEDTHPPAESELDSLLSQSDGYLETLVASCAAVGLSIGFGSELPISENIQLPIAQLRISLESPDVNNVMSAGSSHTELSPPIPLPSNSTTSPKRPSLNLGLDDSTMYSKGSTRFFVEADYTLHLSSELSPHTRTCSFGVNRILLGIRIPYFQTFFSSGFGDSKADHSVLYTDAFSKESLQAIVRYVHLLPLDPVGFWYVSDSPNHVSAFSTYLGQAANVSKDAPPHVFSTEDTIAITTGVELIVNVLRAADYLAADDLEEYMLVLLSQLIHPTLCTRQPIITATLIPKIFTLCHQFPNVVPQSFLDSILDIMAQRSSITTIWKRPLLNVPPDVIDNLIGRTIAINSDTPVTVFLLYIAVHTLRSKTSKSKATAETWDRLILKPIADYAADYLSKDLTAIIPRLQTQLMSPSVATSYAKSATFELLLEISSATHLTPKNCHSVWTSFHAMNVRKWHPDAFANCLNWFKKNWLTLSVGPAIAPDQKTAEGVKKGFSNFFSQWPEEDLSSLGAAVGVSPTDLLGSSKPVKRRLPLAAPSPGGRNKSLSRTEPSHPSLDYDKAV